MTKNIEISTPIILFTDGLADDYSKDCRFQKEYRYIVNHAKDLELKLQFEFLNISYHRLSDKVKFNLSIKGNVTNVYYFIKHIIDYDFATCNWNEFVLSNELERKYLIGN